MKQIIKEYEEPEGCNSCVFTAMKMVTILVIVFVICYMLAGCASTREGCWKYAEPRYQTSKMRA